MVNPYFYLLAYIYGTLISVTIFYFLFGKQLTFVDGQKLNMRFCLSIFKAHNYGLIVLCTGPTAGVRKRFYRTIKSPQVDILVWQQRIWPH